MTSRASDPLNPSLERILNSMDKKMDEIGHRFDALDVKVDRINLSTVSKKEFDSYQDLRRQTTRWAVTTIITVLLAVMAAVITILSTRPDIIIGG